jgi:hypothetical protein
VREGKVWVKREERRQVGGGVACENIWDWWMNRCKGEEKGMLGWTGMCLQSHVGVELPWKYFEPYVLQFRRLLISGHDLIPTS